MEMTGPVDQGRTSLERTRRELFQLVGGAAALIGLAACSNRQRPLSGSESSAAPGAAAGTSPPRTTPAAGSGFIQPEVLSSRDGVLELTLDARASLLPYGDGTRFAYTYNGTSPGPTLRGLSRRRVADHLAQRTRRSDQPAHPWLARLLRR